jgi:hypothetical protein
MPLLSNLIDQETLLGTEVSLGLNSVSESLVTE